MTNEVFYKGLNLIEIATQKRFNEDQTRLYQMLLNDINDEQFIEGITKLLKERVYTNIPAPAEIREYCLGLKEDDLNFKIAEARINIKKSISSAGTYRCVCFEDPVIHAIIKSYGGWIKICNSNIEEFDDFLKWELPKLYKAYNNRKNEIDLFLTGLGYNQEKNMEICYIGNKDRINRWQNAYLNKNLESITYEEKVKACKLGILKEDNLLENKNNENSIKNVSLMIENLRK